ncbi:MAG: Hsp70 family protein [Acidimicrobiales bacterium]|nr:Hsp70 family protein [Acidimicrobiales bacterium]
MAYYLGIDLGTTYTAAAAEREGVVESLTLGNRTASVPSVVFLRDDGEILVGEAATRRATSDPGRVAREFKRRVGDPTPIILGGTPYAAEMLMARLLRWSIDRVCEQQGEPPRAIALTHPANWGPYKLDLLAQAVRQVDLDAALMLPEPVAAATFYASQRRLEPGSVVAVYDLGGGTFDAAMVRRTAGGFETIGTPEGMERLGGIDFDEAVFAHVRAAVDDALDRLDPDEPAAQAAVARLRQECIDAKEALSSDTDVSIPVLLPGLQTEVRLTRSEFEAMIRPAISETIVALRRAIRSAGVSAGDISAVLLVGGSSRIPVVAQMVGAELGRPIAIDAHPKDAISFGASIAVAQRRGGATPESVRTVLADTRPPPPTVASGVSRRPAPPVASAAAGAAPPVPGQRPSRPAPPGAPGGPGSGRLAPPPATTGAAQGAPAAAPAAATQAAARPAPPPPGPATAKPAPPPGAAGRAAPPGAGSAPPRPPAAGAPSGERPVPPGAAPFGGMPRAGGTPVGGHSSGSYPAMPATRAGGADNRILWLVLGTIAAVALIVIIVVSMSGDDDAATPGTDGVDDGYTAEVEQAFMGECTVQGSQASCECAWDEVTETIPFDRFTEIEAELAADPDAEVEELTTIIDACMGAG